jgi:transposase InsO family protein
MERRRMVTSQRRRYVTDQRRRQHEVAVIAYATYYNYHRLHGQLGWQTPAERFDGTLFTDRGFEHVPALACHESRHG